jgi:hypothetical protein
MKHFEKQLTKIWDTCEGLFYMFLGFLIFATIGIAIIGLIWIFVFLPNNGGGDIPIDGPGQYDSMPEW